MYHQLVEKELTSSGRMKQITTPTTSVSIEEAKKLLMNQYKDLVAVTKAMQMLGDKQTITPKVSEHWRGSQFSTDRTTRG